MEQYQLFQAKFEHTLSLSEQRLIVLKAVKTTEEGPINLENSLLKFFPCVAYMLFLDRCWPVDAIPSKSLPGLIPTALRFLKWSLGASLGAVFLSPIVFELIKTQAAILRAHQNNAIAMKREREEASQPVLSYSMNEKSAAVYQIFSPIRVDSPVSLFKSNLYGRLRFDWINGFHEEQIFQALLFRRLLHYLHPALACLLCTVSCTFSCNSFYNELYNGLDVSHSLSLKFIESLLMTLLSYVTLSSIPSTWARSILSWDSTFMDECLKGDPLLRIPVSCFEIMIKHFKFFAGLLPQPAHVNTIKTKPLKALAEEVMLEYSSPFGSDLNSVPRTLTAGESEDFIFALEWACSEEVVKAMAQDEAASKSKAVPSVPLNYVSHLGVPVEYFRGSTLLKLFTPRECNSTVTQWWAMVMEKILLPDSKQRSNDLLHPNDIDPLHSNSREFFASQVQRIDRQVVADSITQNDVEALLLSAISDPAAPTSTSLSSLSRSLLYASNMESDAFLSLMQDRYSFLHQTMDYYSPRMQREMADVILTFYAGLCPQIEHFEETMKDCDNLMDDVLYYADFIFLRSRGLTKRRYQALLNKHSLNPEVKALQREWDEYIEQRRAKKPEIFLKLCKWGY